MHEYGYQNQVNFSVQFLVVIEHIDTDPPINIKHFKIRRFIISNRPEPTRGLDGEAGFKFLPI